MKFNRNAHKKIKLYIHFKLKPECNKYNGKKCKKAK